MPADIAEIKALIGMLSGDDDAQVRATTKLAELVKDPSNSSLIVEAGGVEPLLDLLGMRRLMPRIIAYQVVIFLPEAIAKLVKPLSSGDAGIRKGANKAVLFSHEYAIRTVEQAYSRCWWNQFANGNAFRS